MALFSDPDFPAAMIKLDKGNRIRLCELLYSQYSKREFTNITDRPVAISGLEKRLLHTLSTPGGYGILEKYFGRTLLWRRDGSHFSKIGALGSTIPSWSWMGYKGAINYMNIPYGEVYWSGGAISPFNTSENAKNIWYTGDQRYTTITARVCPLVANAVDGKHLILDDSSDTRMEGLECVVVGSQKGHWRWYSSDKKYQKHYVLLVRQVNGLGDTAPTYERAGVGILETEDIDIDFWKEGIIR